MLPDTGVMEGDKIFICFSFRVLEGDGKEETLVQLKRLWRVGRVYPSEYLAFCVPGF